jgi:hypothetical protein
MQYKKGRWQASATVTSDTCPVLDFDGNNIEACYFGEKAPPE